MSIRQRTAHPHAWPLPREFAPQPLAASVDVLCDDASDDAPALRQLVATQLKRCGSKGKEFRGPLDYVELIDPRSWKVRNPVFLDAYAVLEEAEPAFRGASGRGRPDNRLPRTSRRVLFRENGDPQEDEASVPGQPWHDGLFCEDVFFGMNESTGSRFRNLLGVHFEVSPQKVRVNYRLHRSMTTQLLCLERLGGIDVDSGYCEAQLLEDGQSTRFTIVKKIRFAGSTPRDCGPIGPWDDGQLMNYLAPSMLGAWIDAVLAGVAVHAFKLHGNVLVDAGGYEYDGADTTGTQPPPPHT